MMRPLAALLALFATQAAPHDVPYDVRHNPPSAFRVGKSPAVRAAAKAKRREKRALAWKRRERA